ncbi:MAG: hypothetical protein ACRERU_11780 [Methylococcales bacterium]
MKSTNFGWRKRSQLWIVGVLGMLAPLVVSAEHGPARNVVIHGDPVTGINRLCGLPVFSLPVPAGVPDTAGATNLGEYNPGGALPIDLSPTNCSDDIVLATDTDPGFLAAIGLADVDPRVKNIPLRQNFVITGLDGSRSMVPSLDQVPGNALPPTRSNPNDPITLGQWLSTRGVMRIRCGAGGQNIVQAVFSNLIPNGVYTMWGVWNTTPPGAPSARIVPVPLGGIPNALVPDRRGNASFFRELASCPIDVTDDGSILMFITLAYHSDSDLNGAVPEIGTAPATIHAPDGTVFSTTFGPGAVTHDAIEFLINGTRL